MGTEQEPGIQISVVVPLFNEQENVAPLVSGLTETLSRLGRSYEIVLVNDGSTDETAKRLSTLAAADGHVRTLTLRRNFGQTAAFSAGFDHARGAVVVTLDGDLQFNPADIPAMLARLDQGFDMVCGWRHPRQDPLSKRIPSWFANRMIAWTTGVRLHDFGCSLKAMHADVAKGIAIDEVAVNHRPRARGTSKYGLGRTTRVLLDLLTVKFLLAYGTRPAHLFGLMGLGFGGVGMGVLGYLAYIRLFEDTAIGGRPMLLLGALLFLTGVLFINFGLIGELLVRTYHESQGKPVYVLKPPRTPERRESH
jgi:glycosyltransferase involved in cell wall biosynthesis